MSGHYTDGRRWSYISKAWIFVDSWNDREEIARLEDKLRQVEDERDQYRSLLVSQCELQERLERAEQERDQLRDGYRRVENDKYQLLRAIDDVLTVYDTDLACRYIAELKQDNATLRARVGELEGALLDLVEQVEKSEAVDPHGHRLENLQALHLAKRALEGKEEHGSDG